MELQVSSSFPFLFCVLILTILMVVKMQKRCKPNPNLPQVPWKLPLIGNMHQMVGSLPHHKLRDLSQKYGPLMHLQFGEVSLVVVSSPELAKEVMKKHDIKFANRPHLLVADTFAYGSTDIVFSPYGEYWRQLRKICTLELLSTRRVQSFRSVREEEMLNLVDWISSNNDGSTPINLSEKLFSLGYATTSRTAFGKKSKDQDRFILIAKQVIKLAAGFHIGDVFPSHKWLYVITGMKSKLERLHCEADRILSDIIEDHLQKKVVGDDGASEEDLVDVLLKFMGHNDLGFSLTLDNIKAVIFDMFLGGSETSVIPVVWAMAEMMKNPRILKKAQSEVRHKFDKKGRVEEDGLSQLQYLQLIIKETLRLHPPTVFLPKECGEECEVGGFKISSNTKVIINAWALGRDPKYWKEAENFNPERFLDNPIDFKGNHFEYLPFGAGRRMCPGVVFGLTSMEYQIAMLLHHFDWKLPNSDQELDMTEEFGGTVSMKNGLYLVPTPYNRGPPSF